MAITAGRTTSPDSHRSAFARCVIRSCGNASLLTGRRRPTGRGRTNVSDCCARATSDLLRRCSTMAAGPAARTCSTQRSPNNSPHTLARLRLDIHGFRTTPVNEPLTTARFSALYGHWYPHHRDDRSFVKAFLNELRAIVLAMTRIRQVNPTARLIQTEDAGRTDSTPALADQAEFENHRRWLTFDVLAGRVSHEHPLWSWLLDCGASLADLQWFVDHPCLPDVIGLNYYLTSDRYLDEHVGRNPLLSHGTNGREQYQMWTPCVPRLRARAPSDTRGSVAAIWRCGGADRSARRVHERRPAALVRQRMASRRSGA